MFKKKHQGAQVFVYLLILLMLGATVAAIIGLCVGIPQLCENNLSVLIYVIPSIIIVSADLIILILMIAGRLMSKEDKPKDEK